MEPRKDQFGRCIQKVPTIITSTNRTSRLVPKIAHRQNALDVPLTSTNQGQHNVNPSDSTPSKSENGSETSSEALPVSVQPAHSPNLLQTDKSMQPCISRTSVSHPQRTTSTDGLNTVKSNQNSTTVCTNSGVSYTISQSVALPVSITSNAVQHQEGVKTGEQNTPIRTMPTANTSKPIVSHKLDVVIPQSSHVASQSVPQDEDTVKNVPPTRTVTTGRDPRLKIVPSAATHPQPKTAASDSGLKSNEPSVIDFQDALSNKGNKEDTAKNVPRTRTETTGRDPRLKIVPSAATHPQPKTAASNSGLKSNEPSVIDFQEALSNKGNREDTVKNVPQTSMVTTGRDPRLKIVPSAATHPQPKTAASNSGLKSNEPLMTGFQDAFSNFSVAINLLAKQRGTKTDGMSTKLSKSAQSSNESTLQSDGVSTATSFGAKCTTNPGNCSAPKAAKSPESMVCENTSRKANQVSSPQCSPQKVMVRSPSKSTTGTQPAVRDPRLSSKLYSTIVGERQSVSPVAASHPSPPPATGRSPVKRGIYDARYGVFGNQREDQINSAAPGGIVPLPKRFSPQKRRMDSSLQPRLAFKGASHSGIWPGSRHHLTNSNNFTNCKAASTNQTGKASEVMYPPSKCLWKTGTSTALGSGRIRENNALPSKTSSPTRKVLGSGHTVCQSTVIEQLVGRPDEANKNPLSKELQLSPNNKKTEPNLASAVNAPSVVEGKGHTKGPRSKFQKSRSFVHPRSQPSFLELLRIASRNATKGKQVGDSLNLQDSRKRRHSDGQINKRKFSEVAHPEDLAYYKIQKLEKLPGQTETMSEMNRAVNSESDQRAVSSVAETTDASVKVNNELMAASGAVMDSDGQVMTTKSSSVVGEPTIIPPNNLAASPTKATGMSTSGDLMSDSGSSAILKSNRSPYFEQAIDAAEDSNSQKNAGELENALTSMPEKNTDKNQDKNQGSSVVQVGTAPSECQAERQITDGDVPAADAREEQLQQMEEDDDINDGVDDSSSDDDDSFLMDTPSALIPDTSALLDTPMPVTPSKPSASNMNFSPSPRVQSHLNFEPQTKKVGYTLDKMLHMKNDQEMKNGDIATIRSKLMKVVSEGGIAQLASEALTEDERDVNAAAREYAQCLAQCMSQMEKIPDSPPGEEIFCQEKVQQLFTPSQCLVAQHWGVTRSSSVGDALCDATEDEMEEFIQTGFFDCFYSRSQIPQDIMRWMFLLMSIHPSSMESQILYNTLWGQLNKASLSLDELEFPWTPTLKDIITVMINYGGDLASLVSVSDCEVSFSEDDLRLETNQSAESRDGYWKDEEVYGLLLENHIGSVVKIITQAIITYITLKDCSGYRTEELQCLLIIMFRIALDKHIVGLPVTVDIANAISTILEGFEETVWSHQVERLCILFPLITGHHHNMVYLLQSCIPLHIERGRCLYRMLGYAGLQTLVFPEKGLCNMTEEKDLKVSRLIPILHCCKPSTDTDYYQLHSIILLLDFSIGNEILSASERMDLDQIIRKLREMVGEIRDNSLTMSMSQVKSLIVRTATKLSFMTQAMVTKQAGVFSFLRSDNMESLELPEHHVSSQTDGASLPSEDESSAEMEDEEEEPTSSKVTGCETSWSAEVECKLSESEVKGSEPSEQVDLGTEIIQTGETPIPKDINTESEPAKLTTDGEIATVLTTDKKIKEEKLGADSPAKKLKVETEDNLNELAPPMAANRTGQSERNLGRKMSLPSTRMKTDVIDLTCSDEDNDNDDDNIEFLE